MKMSSCCWGSEGVWGGYPPPAIAGRTCCWGSGGGTPPDQLLADAAVGVRGGVPPLNQELPGACNISNYVFEILKKSALLHKNEIQMFANTRQHRRILGGVRRC